MSSRPLSDLVGHRFGDRHCSFDERDAILYALAVGAHASELNLVYESLLTVLPTFALTLGLWALEEGSTLCGYDQSVTLHVGQRLEVHRPLPTAGSLSMSATIVATWDKGSAAVIEYEVESEYFTAGYVVFVPGAGSFGGERGPRATDPEPAGPPSWRRAVETSPDQAALYRLTGDRNPLHVDPEVARAAGFDGPLLHGLATLGVVALDLSRALGRDPGDLRRLTARFSQPVYPGETIEIAGWADPSGTRFRAAVDSRGTVLTGTAHLS